MTDDGHVLFTDCPHGGDVQECLDKLIDLNRKKISWEQHIFVELSLQELESKPSREMPTHSKAGNVRTLRSDEECKKEDEESSA